MTALTVERPRRANGHVPPPPPPTGGGDPDREPGPRRPLIDNLHLAMLFLICGEIMFFGALVSAFLVPAGRAQDLALAEKQTARRAS